MFFLNLFEVAFVHLTPGITELRSIVRASYDGHFGLRNVCVL